MAAIENFDKVSQRNGSAFVLKLVDAVLGRLFSRVCQACELVVQGDPDLLFAVVVVVVLLGDEPCLKKTATGLFVLPNWLEHFWLVRALLCDKVDIAFIHWFASKVIV